jgi:hypothetical protein
MNEYTNECNNTNNNNNNNNAGSTIGEILIITYTEIQGEVRKCSSAAKQIS